MSSSFLPPIKPLKNRIYVSWRNKKNIECKMIGPETKCFCNHRFKEHDNQNIKVHCNVKINH